MAGFDLLDRHLNYKGRYFLEASAGTGKTFAIETIVTRLLLESDDFKISNILIVTFTKAATEELKVRVMKRLRETLEILKNEGELPDFLKDIKERGKEELTLAIKRVERALYSFDKAKIFTLHGFCLYALRRHDPLSNLLLKDVAPSMLIDEIAKDFLRGQTLFSIRELSLLVKAYQDMESLLREIRQLVEKRVPIKIEKGEKELFSLLKEECEKLKEKYHPEPSALLSDLLIHAKNYKGMCDRKKEIKEEVKEGFLQLSDFFFCKGELPDASLLSAMIEERKLKRSNEEKENYPGLVQEMQKKIGPLIEDALDPLFLLGRIAEEVRRATEQKIEREELFFYQDLILKMKKAVETPAFNQLLRQEFRALFIDEFQDVDSDLWKIFSTLFISPDFSGPIYFIGDPKQSIYRFRGADLYSYEKAKKDFSASVASLSVNFRSQPKLLLSLNHLFSQPSLFLLPKTKESLVANPLVSGIKKEPLLNDSRAPVHFFCASREEELFHFIVSEISRLHEKGLSFSDCAVLVRDRAQKERFMHFASRESLPVTSSRGRILSDSSALFFLIDLMKACSYPKERKALSKLFLWPHFLCKCENEEGFFERNEGRNPSLSREDQGQDVKNVEKSLTVEESPYCQEGGLQEEFLQLSEILREEGLLPWFTFILKKGWIKGDEEFFCDLFQLIEMMADKKISPDRRIHFLETLSEESEDSERVRARLTSKNAVQILTIHASKGLEYEVVFPLGLISELKERRELLYDPSQKAITFSDQALLSHQQEEEAEGTRLLYVAMTRAKERLYLPFIEKKKNSLISLFLQKRLNGQSLEVFCEENQGFSFSVCDGKEEINIKEKKEDQILSLSLPDLPRFTSSFQQSFSSLAKSYLPTIVPGKEKSLLPSGKAFGSFLHGLMEELPWKEAVSASSSKEISLLLAPHFALTSYADFMLPICELIFKTLHAPLLGNSSFSLSDIQPQKIFRELEFLFPEKNDFIKGFIDLLFEHEGKVYFVDWKTNDLGDSPENYNREKLFSLMQAHDYLLQADLYREAINRYFSLFSPQWSCGGGFFIFVRGVDEKGNGIYVYS